MLLGDAAWTGDAAAARALARAARRALASTIAVVLCVGGALAGAGALGDGWSGDVDGWRRASGRSLMEETAAVVVALPLDELVRLDGRSIVPDDVPVESADFRVDLEVEDVPSGVRVNAVLFDNRTREAVKDFVAFRSRS